MRRHVAWCVLALAGLAGVGACGNEYQQGTGGSGGGAGGGAPCADACCSPTDCPEPDRICITRTCVAGQCGETATAEGTASPWQIRGDCQSYLCDASGRATTTIDGADVLDDGNDCTADRCDADRPMNDHLPVGSPCAQGGGAHCNDRAECVQCTADAHCAGGLCTAGGACVPQTCADDQQNAGETDVDCGGPCVGTCDPGEHCQVAADCVHEVCSGGICAAPTCTDQVQNGDEADIDCGGSCARKCGPLQRCQLDADCAGGQCTGAVCAPGCGDGVKNGAEIDVDCGGPSCAPCALGAACQAGADCASGFCADGRCCDSACGGECVACAEAKTGAADGACAPIPAGQDPEDECAPEAASTCGNSTGHCGGDGRCEKHPAGTECRPAAGVCDVAEVCDGSGAACPADGVKGVVEVCRAAAGVCDVAESCDGVGKACPGDALRPAGSVCEAATCSGTTRIAADTCNGGGVCVDGGTMQCAGGCVSGVCTQCQPGTSEACCYPSAADCGAGERVCNSAGSWGACENRRVVEVRAGYYHTCARLADGRLKCWGCNGSGELGLGDTAARGDGPAEMGAALPAVDLGTGKSAIAVVPGNYRSCAILNDNTIKCWGDSNYGALGGSGGIMGNALPVVQLGTGKWATAISAGLDHNCALLNDGSTKCWGYNGIGQLGLGDTSDRGYTVAQMGDNLPPAQLATGKTAIQVAAGRWHTCALLNDGNIQCWGDNMFHELGITYGNEFRGDEPGEMGDANPLIQHGAGKLAISVSTRGFHTCILISDATLRCFGYNGNGQLGRGDTSPGNMLPGQTTDVLPPVQLGAAKTASAVAAGNAHTCAILNDARVKCWGYNALGVDLLRQRDLQRSRRVTGPG